MKRTPHPALAALTVTLLSHAAIAEKQTLRIQLGKDQEILDTVTVVVDYDQPPEVPNPDGHDWADQEKDSAWTDNSGRHLQYNHHFKVTMGSRKGFGSDFISVDDFGTGRPSNSSGILLTFPGDSTLIYSWNGVHMTRHADAYPFTDTEFLTGRNKSGQVILWPPGGEGRNLAEGQWVCLLTRKRERPAGVSKPIVSRKETLHIQHARQNSDDARDVTLLDTLVLWIDYGKLPEVAPPAGHQWSDFEKDSAWMDDESWGIRYSHSFMASLGKRKGQGGEYLSVRVFRDDFAGNEQYNSNVTFTIPGDTSLFISFDPSHIVEKAEAYPFHETGFRVNGTYGQVQKRIGNGEFRFAEREWVLLIKKEAGWTGFGSDGPTTVRSIMRRGHSNGWLFHYSPGSRLQAPPGAKALRIIDLQGRLHWEARNIAQDVPVLLPGRLPAQPLRFQWISDPIPGRILD